MIIVTGTLQARADTIDELRRLSLEHGVAVDVNDGLRLVFFERWADRAALDTHFKVPASVAFVKHAAQLSAQPPTISLYESSEISLR